MRSLDPTYGFHVGLYVLSLECILFFFVVSESRSQDPYTHGEIAKYFSLTFLFESVASFTCVVSIQLYPGSTSELFAIISHGFIIAVILTLPLAAAAVAVPEMRHRFWKLIILFLGFSVLAACALTFGKSAPLSMDIGFVSTQIQGFIVASMFGGLGTLLLASTVRLLRPPSTLKGRSGAAVLCVGTLMTLVTAIIWALMKSDCTFAKGSLSSDCTMPQVFDHNAMFVLAAIVANGFVAEGALRLMAAGSGTDNYVQI